MNRFGAFLVHLGISLIIFAVLAYLVLYVWYPDYFFDSDGGWQGMRIIILVDLVLGPTLTLIVFNRRKPATELRRDLTVIGSIQIACLTAGVYVVYTERPIALVYVDGQYFSMSRDDYLNANVEVPDLDRFPGPYPKKVVVDIPTDLWRQAELRRQAIQQQKPLRTLTSRYVPHSYDHLQADAESIEVETLREHEPLAEDVAAWVAKHPGTLEDYAFFPFGARYGNFVLGVSKSSGNIVGLMDSPLQPVETAARQ